MNILPLDKRVRIVAALVEGFSLRASARMVGVSVNTVAKFLADLGPVCEEYHDLNVRGVKSNRVRCNEVWAFCYAKSRPVPAHMRDQPGVGNVWTWTATDADSRLMVWWMLGERNAESAGRFMHDLSRRLDGRCQLTTDGHAVYERAVQDAFGWQIDYAMLVKLYGEPHSLAGFVERQNLAVRMEMGRTVRLTDGFSKRLANHRAAVALHFTHYNFCRVHKTLRVTPAMEAGLADHVWDLEELVGLLSARETAAIGTDANKRGPYRKAKDSN